MVTNTQSSRTAFASSAQGRTGALVWIGVAAMLAFAAPAYGDENDRRRQAGAAYAQAENEALAGNLARAAELFEQAYVLAPTPQALRAALQLRNSVGHHRVAIGQAEELLRRYPYDVTSRALAIEVLDQLSSRFVRAYIVCQAECQIQVDGRTRATPPSREHILYLQPGRHRITAVFSDGRTVSKRLRRDAGEPVSMTIEAPPLAALGESIVDIDGDRSQSPESGDLDYADSEGAPIDLDRAPGLAPTDGSIPGSVGGAGTEVSTDQINRPPLMPLAIGGALTLGLGGATLWSHSDAVSQNAGPDDGASVRTRVLLATTAVAAAGTVVLSVVWARMSDEDPRSSSDRGPSLGLAADGNGYWVGLTGNF